MAERLMCDRWVRRFAGNDFVLRWLRANPAPPWWSGTAMEWAYSTMPIYNHRGIDRRPEAAPC